MYSGCAHCPRGQPREYNVTRGLHESGVRAGYKSRGGSCVLAGSARGYLHMRPVCDSRLFKLSDGLTEGLTLWTEGFVM